ncbi:MAG: thioredoxin domain-containing protein [Protaetiibacter sp.]
MTNAPRPTKNQRREEAREAARLAREKQLKRQKLLMWLIPTIASVALLAIVGGVVWAVFAFLPAPKKEAGPLNMLSDGILFESDGAGGVQYVATDAIAEGGDPVATTPRDGVLNIVTYVDFTCPVCQQFEAAYSESIQQLVASGSATLEVHPVAILDHAFTGSEVSTRANNVGACVANYAPDQFLDVMTAMYDNQAEEGGVGLSNSDLVAIVKGAGVTDEDVISCINGESFTPWVTAATARSGISGTPTVVINGTQWDSSSQGFEDFVTAEFAKLQG